MKNLRDLTYAEILNEVAALGEKPYRALQIYGWVYKKRAPQIDSMTDISKALRDRLKEGFYIGGVSVAEVKESKDGARKFLCALEDGLVIETVLIPEGRRLTLCVSSQAGCPLGCRFCKTGKTGFVRNLNLSELTGQVTAAEGILKGDERITNVVLMGMGEPLLNYENVLKFISVLTDGKALGFSHNKVTLSTSGIIPGIRRLGEDCDINLAVSLNATTDEIRSSLMPVNKKYPIAGLIEALKSYPLKGRKAITVEYVLIKDVNDTLEDARRLVRMLRPIKCKVNLIPFNEFKGSNLSRPSVETVNAFHSILREAGYTVIVRASKGSEIQAACGQLSGWYSGQDELAASGQPSRP